MAFEFKAPPRVVGAVLLPLLLLSAAACAPGEPRSPASAPRAASSAPESGHLDLPPPTPESTAKVDELIARHLAARGGLDRIRALKSIRLTGTERFSEDDFNLEAS